jgi:hypothetical protein
MKALLRALVVAMLPLGANAQGMATIIHEKPVQARQLDGYVRVYGLPDDSEPVSSVRIEECDAGWKHVLNSTTTDERGYFHMTPAAKGSTHYLRLTAPTFNPSLYTVKLSLHAPPELDLRITVAN